MDTPRRDLHLVPIVDELARLDAPERRKVVESLSDRDATALALGLAYDWDLWARPEQKAPTGEWDTWIMLGGRGCGKTRSGAQQFIAWAKDNPLLAMMAKDDAMVRDVQIEGESGILACSPPWWKPEYDRSKLRLTWPNGAMALKLTAEAGADAGRGRQYYKGWAEEVSAWPNARSA